MTTHSITIHIIIQSIVKLSVSYAECHYAECRYAECRGALGCLIHKSKMRAFSLPVYKLDCCQSWGKQAERKRSSLLKVSYNHLQFGIQ
jgi:hypothetical protein